MNFSLTSFFYETRSLNFWASLTSTSTIKSLIHSISESVTDSVTESDSNFDSEWLIQNQSLRVRSTKMKGNWFTFAFPIIHVFHQLSVINQDTDWFIEWWSLSQPNSEVIWFTFI